MKYLNTIICADALEGLKSLPDESVHCCVTSPPYWGLRDYGVDGQIGLENTAEQFIERLIEVFMEVRRALRNDGTLWVNIGDSYAHNGAAYHSEKSTLIGRKQGSEMGEAKRFVKNGNYLKPKDLVGIPWMLAFALRADGWYLRQDIIWSKPNPMPESVTDRCTRSHEYIFMLSKSKKYYYDAAAIRTPAKQSSINRWNQNVHDQNGSDRVPGKTNGNMKAVGSPIGANKRSVWTVATKPFNDAHFATFPETLIVDMLKAGCPPDGIVLDPFMGAGTTALVARKLNRNYIGIEINPNYVKIAENRLKTQLGMFV